jgi:hypothetical protein
MTEVLHTSPQKRRPWTAQEQTTLEVAAACGISFKKIAAAMHRPETTLRLKVGHGASLERKQAKAQQEKAWRIANIERKRAVDKIWQEANRERKRDYDKARYEGNRELICAKQKSYYQSNRERCLACSKAWYYANRERFNLVAQQWRNANRNRVRETRLRIARTFTQVTLRDKRRRYALWNDCCAYCGKAGKMTVDHVLAIKHGGLDEPSNIVPACHSCNCSKNAKPAETWYRSQSFFTEARWRKIQRHCPAAVVGQLSIGA